MDDVYVRIVKLPSKVRGFSMPGMDGMNVYISEDLDENQRLEAYDHEMKHIVNGDFEKTDVQAIEMAAH